MTYSVNMQHYVSVMKQGAAQLLIRVNNTDFHQLSHESSSNHNSGVPLERREAGGGLLTLIRPCSVYRSVLC